MNMKKILLLMMIAIGLFASCMGPPGRDGAEPYWFIKTYTINSNQWKLVNGVNELNSFYQAEVRIPELTKDIYEDGIVLCYMFQNVNGTEVQTLLPYVVPFGEERGDSEYLWTEMFAWDFTPGSIMFYVNYSDFLTDNRPPTTSFRVVLNY